MQITDKLILRTITFDDREWIEQVFRERWASIMVVSKGVVHNAAELPGFVALVDGTRQGIVTYRVDGNECEIVTLDSLQERKGIGTRLIEAVINLARAKNLRRVFLITSNDNIDALCFYQKRNFVIKAVYPNAIEKSRQLKPEIPLVGNYGIPIRDELELEYKIPSLQVSCTDVIAKKRPS